tara:strand:+ start:1092 stop:1355 length:264 start_codon:yes stop_codon:yes gene_type:complete
MTKLKLVIFATVLIGTGYPIFELTRCIIKYMLIGNMGTQPMHVYYAELALILGLYVAMWWLLNKAINLIWLKARREAKLEARYSGKA